MNLTNNERGFTLIESLIALFILSFGILALIMMQTTAVKGNARSQGLTVATSWAQDRVEQLLTEDFDYTGDTADDLDKGLQDTDTDGSGGLDDSECCSDGNDPQGDAVAGCAQKADSCFTKDTFNIYLNIDDTLFSTVQPNSTLKQIRVIIKHTVFENEQMVTFDYYKQDTF
jgi:type IV pilus modification protein PilV